MMHAEDINDKVTLIKYAIWQSLALMVEPNLSPPYAALVICLIYIGGSMIYKFIGTGPIDSGACGDHFPKHRGTAGSETSKDYQQHPGVP